MSKRPPKDSVAKALYALDKKLLGTNTQQELFAEDPFDKRDVLAEDWEAAIETARAKNTIHAHSHEVTCRKIQIWTIPIVFGFVALWLICTQVALALVGCNILTITDTVMVAYLTTTTVNVIGLLYVILKWLYHIPIKQ